MIPGSPVAYWWNTVVFDLFHEKPLSFYAEPKVGVQTGNNEKFLRLWYEVQINNIEYGINSVDDTIGCNTQWFPCNKGGTYRRWYGNNWFIVDWKKFETK